jgi:hypothetical protein
MKFKFLKSIITSIVMIVAMSANAGLIAINDGSVKFSATEYINGYGSFGDANFIDNNYIDSLIPFGDDVIIKVTMGVYTDYFKPIDGINIQEMLTSNNKHTWAPNLVTSFIAPSYFSNQHLGGSAVGWPNNTVIGDTRPYLSFWGSTTHSGGCCSATSGDRTWGLAFKVETVNSVPEPSTLAIFALGMIGLASRRFKK